MTDTTTLLILAAAIVVAMLAVLLILRGRRQRVSLGETAAKPLMRNGMSPTLARSLVPAAPEGHGVADEAIAAVENVIGEIIGIDAHHDRSLDTQPAPADELTLLKGLGPKAAAQLNTLGITRFDQLAALSPVQAETLDNAMGAFKGRVARDKWVEQARLLSTGDRAGFEAAFGKLG